MGVDPKNEDWKSTTDEYGIRWADDVRPPERRTKVDWSQVEIPGAVANCDYSDLADILCRTWRLASWLPQRAVTTVDAEGWSTQTLVAPGDEIPESAEVVEWDHDHCEVSFCGVSIHTPRDVGDEPRTDLAYTDGRDYWLCRKCAEAILKHWEALVAGLRTRGYEIEPVEFERRTGGERYFPPH